MIHTGEFFVKLDSEEDDIRIKERFNSIKVYSEKDIFRVVYRNTYNIGRLHIFVDFIELLGKPDIVESDIDDIIYKLENTVEGIIGNNKFELVLSRLDYRYDVVIKDKNERAMIIKLLKKAQSKCNYMKSINKYTDTIRYYSKSRSDNMYDKEIERLAKGKEIKPYEIDVLRFEAQIKNEHIKYKKRKSNLERCMESYFTYDMYKLYMEKMIIGVVGTGDFYSLREAEKIINQAKIKENYKKELRDFLVYTSSKRGLSKTRKKYSRHKFEKFISILEELGVNPIIIPEKWKVKFIENPLKGLVNEFSNDV